MLDRWLKQAPRRLGPERVTVLASIAAEPATWGISVEQCVDAEQVRERFDILRRRVVRARRVQRSWAALGTLAAAGAFVALTYAILMRTLAA